MKRTIGKWLIVLGGLLVVLGSGWLLMHHVVANTGLKNTHRLLEYLDALLPERTAGVITDTDHPMPELVIEGHPLVAVVELPTYGIRLPVGNRWNEQDRMTYPRRFSGSAYRRNLVIGGSDQEGQLECLSRVEPGDVVTVTDMTGAVFTYTVDRVDRLDAAEVEKRLDPTAHLTLFIRDTYSLEYILVRCIAR